MGFEPRTGWVCCVLHPVPFPQLGWLLTLQIGLLLDQKAAFPDFCGLLKNRRRSRGRVFACACVCTCVHVSSLSSLVLIHYLWVSSPRNPRNSPEGRDLEQILYFFLAENQPPFFKKGPFNPVPSLESLSQSLLVSWCPGNSSSVARLSPSYAPHLRSRKPL